MHLAFELSGEHQTLPRAEVFACLQVLKLPYAERIFCDGVLVVEVQPSPLVPAPAAVLGLLSKRLALTHCVYEVKGVSTSKLEAEESEILAVVKEAVLNDFSEEGQREGQSERQGEGQSEGQGETFAVRVRGKRKLERGLGRAALERKAGEIIKRRGYEVNLRKPSKTFVLLFAGEACLFCLLLHPHSAEEEKEKKRQFAERRPHLRPFFSPGVLKPKLARALVNLSGVRAGGLLLDPFCGTGGLLLEAGLPEVGARVVGLDVQEKMVRGARENLRLFGVGLGKGRSGEDFVVLVGDASKIPLQDSSVDAVVTDLPYGRSSLVAGSGCSALSALYQNALAEIQRVLKPGRRAVVVSNSPTFFSLLYNFRLLERHAYRVHKSLTRYVAVAEAKSKNSLNLSPNDLII
ncbi:MAG TPA: methyltransferase domain-containing protein [Methanomicrobia archaeon]|nr:methyltransferase domain-containing protein [Methanomicrobia archaeon]